MVPNNRRNNFVANKHMRPTVFKNELITLSSNHNKKCMFCGRKESSEMLYGVLYQLNDVIVHLFCILLSEKSIQNGADDEGVCGFLPKDIKAELNRGCKILCYYCNKPGATIACSKVGCLKVFHLPCGLENGSLHQYFDQFKSFCLQHRVVQIVDKKELEITSAPVPCGICKENTFRTSKPSSLWAPCCKHNAWFHRKCVQELALNAGYFFKCPLCNNVDIFQKRMLFLGIYIPSRDASWETVPNAFVELLERPNTCSVETCICPHEDERSFSTEIGPWELLLCHFCGSNGTHRICSGLKDDDETWLCSVCHNIEDSDTQSSTSIEEINEPELLSRRITVTRTVSRNTEILETTRPYQELDTIVISDDDSDHDSDAFPCIDLTMSDDENSA